MFPYLNPSIKCAFRWYKTEEERTRHTQECNEDAKECPFAFLLGPDDFLPFQILAVTGGGLGTSEPTGWTLNDLDGVMVHNLSSLIDNLQVEQFGASDGLPAREYVILDNILSHGLTIAPGLYEMIITTAGGTYYSETVRVCDAQECFHVLTWRNCGDIGTQRYRYRDFTNVMYFDRKSFIGHPAGLVTIETQAGERGSESRITARKDVTWKLQIPDLPWYKLDALSEVPLHKTVTLMKAGRSGADDLSEIAFSYTWPEGEVCSVQKSELTFQLNESPFVSACCDSFDPPCAVSCITAYDQYPSDDELVLDEIYLLPNGGYGTYYSTEQVEHPVNALGFGDIARCPARLATITGIGIVYYTGTEWEPVLTLVDLEIGSSPEEIILTGTAMQQYGVQVQWSDDNVTFYDVDMPFTSDQFASGITVVVPEGAQYFRVKLVGTDCDIETSNVLTYGYAEPYGCTGNGYATYTVYDTDTTTFTSSTGEATFRGPDLNLLALPSPGAANVYEGVWCMAATEDGLVIGDITRAGLYSVSSFDVTGLTALEEFRATGTFFTVDLSSQVSMDYLVLVSPFLRTVDITNSVLIRQVEISAPLINFYFVAILGFETVIIIGGSLDEATVDAVFNALDPTVTGKFSTIQGGTNAAPTAASLTNRNAYIANGNTITHN